MFQMFKQLLALIRCYESGKKLTILSDESMIHGILKQHCIFTSTIWLFGNHKGEKQSLRKEVSITEELAEKLLEELNCETVFTIPIFGGIPIAESVVVTWVIMLALTVISIILVRNLQVENPGKKQQVLEMAIGGLYNFFESLIGEEGKRYIPYLISVAIYIGVANLIGIIGFKPPTKDLNATAALAFMSIVLIEYSGFHKKGVKGFFKAFAEPMPLLTPMNIMELFIRPLSLCMRLFGNVLGSFVVMELIKQVAGFIVPIPFTMYFDIFDGLIQAYVFVFLTGLFMKEALE